MAPNHYDTLRVHPEASQAEIKQAYRRLVKLFHPDSNCADGNHEQITQINAAYEILGDPQQRQFYDWQIHPSSPTRRHQRTAATQKQHQVQHPTGQHIDEYFQLWLKQVYSPVNQLLRSILEPLQEQLDELAADPFDDELMEEFQDYLEGCRQRLSQAQQLFCTLPNPANVAGVAAHLYYCLNQAGDGLEELEFFTLNYDDHYIHTGQELFRIATGLRWEAEQAIKNIT